MFPFALATDIISGMHRLATLKGHGLSAGTAQLIGQDFSLGYFP